MIKCTLVFIAEWQKSKCVNEADERSVFYPEKQAGDGTLCQTEGRPEVAIESSIHHARIHSTWTQWETSTLHILVEVGTE